MSSGRRMLVLLAAAGALTAMLWPALIGRDILGFRDMLHNYGPMRELFWSGRISFWNDRAFGGSSVLADIVQQPFYLGQLAMRALHAPAWPGISIRVWMHTLLGMVAMYFLMRRFVAAEAACAGAAAFGLCGFSIADFSNPQWACAHMWVPAVLLAVDHWASVGGLARGSLLAVALPQPFLAGDPLLCAMVGGVGAAWAFARRNRPARRVLCEGAIIAAIAGLIASPQLVATLRAMPSFARASGLPRDVREQWSLHPARIAELFVPRLFGPLFSEGFWGEFTVSPPWTRNYVHSIYAGAVGPGLVALAVWRRQRKALPWILIGCATLVLALGSSFFHLYGRMGDLIPALRVFRYPQRIIALFSVAWAALIALGADTLEELPRSRRLTVVLTSFALGFAALTTTAAFAPAANAAAVWRSAAQLGIVGAASLAALLLPRHALPALGLVLVADLSFANAELLGLLPRAPFRNPSAACEALDEVRGDRRISSFRVYVDQDALGARDVSWEQERVREYNYGKRNVLEVCGYRQAVSLNSLDPVDELRLWREVSPMRTLRVMGTRYAITAPESAAAYGGVVRYTDAAWSFVVVEMPDVSPLLFRPQTVEQIAPEHLPAAARHRPELLGTQVAALESAPGPHRPDATAKLVSWADSGGEIHFRVRQKEAGYWLIGATLDQDWTARVDGALSRIARSDLVRRAVWVPPGEHRVTLRYGPSLQMELFAISLLLTVGLAALGIWRLLQPSTRTPGAAI